MTARADMSAAGLRVLDLLTIPEAAARLRRSTGMRYSPEKVTRLAAAGELTREDMGALARITPESVAAYEMRQAAGAEASKA